MNNRALFLIIKPNSLENQRHSKLIQVSFIRQVELK